MVSGDGTQRAHLLRPTSEDPSNWIYQMETILFVNATVGGIAIGNLIFNFFLILFHFK